MLLLIQLIIVAIPTHCEVITPNPIIRERNFKLTVLSLLLRKSSKGDEFILMGHVFLPDINSASVSTDNRFYTHHFQIPVPYLINNKMTMKDAVFNFIWSDF
jgi:hypothetical protein